jgi:hypothetical protein
MAFCKYTEQIYDYECLGDSLQKINQNFSNLNKAVCEIPEPLPGPGISVDFNITEQDQSVVTIAAENSYDYRPTFESYDSGAEQTVLAVKDSTNLHVTEFPYSPIEGGLKPTATFTTIAKAKSFPQVTIYWLASGEEPTTTFPLNSAIADNNRGSLWFNDTVSCFLSASEGLYVGGAFQSVGTNFSQKLALIDINTTSQGQFVSSPIPFLGQIGEVRDIKKTSVTVNNIVNELLIVGGTFESIGTNGRGLAILNKTNGLIYPWYVNGDVNALEIVDGILYVGGVFDYISYGPIAASVASGQRFATNGFVSINLASVVAGLATSSLLDFSGYLSRNAIIYSFAKYEYNLYIGGKFQIKSATNEITHQNLYSIDLTPFSVTNSNYISPWVPVSRFRPLVNGPVYTLCIDNTIANGGSVYLYVGGHFSKVYSYSQFYTDPRNKSVFVNKTNAFCIQITNVSTIKPIPDIILNWSPKINGPVLNFLSNNNLTEDYILCYGQFGSVNDQTASHLCAIGKASSTTLRNKIHPYWKPGVQNGPSIPNKALLIRPTLAGNTLIVGGNFDKVSKHYRYNLAEISCISNAYNLKNLSWDCGGHVVSPGNPFAMDLYASTTSRVSGVPFEINQLNSTVFIPMVDGFKELTPGQPLRFFVRRPGKLCDTDDTFTQPAYVVGWKVDYNN